MLDKTMELLPAAVKAARKAWEKVTLDLFEELIARVHENWHKTVQRSSWFWDSVRGAGRQRAAARAAARRAAPSPPALPLCPAQVEATIKKVQSEDSGAGTLDFEVALIEASNTITTVLAVRGRRCGAREQCGAVAHARVPKCAETDPAAYFPAPRPPLRRRRSTGRRSCCPRRRRPPRTARRR